MHAVEKRCNEEEDSKTRTVTQVVFRKGYLRGRSLNSLSPGGAPPQERVLQALNKVAIAGMFYYYQPVRRKAWVSFLPSINIEHQKPATVILYLLYCIALLICYLQQDHYY